MKKNNVKNINEFLEKKDVLQKKGKISQIETLELILNQSPLKKEVAEERKLQLEKLEEKKKHLETLVSISHVSPPKIDHSYTSFWDLQSA